MQHNLKVERERIASSRSDRHMARFMSDAQTRTVLSLEADGFVFVTAYFRFTHPGRIAVQMKLPNGTNMARHHHKFKRAIVYPDGDVEYFGTNQVALREGY
jgi:adenine/guanine phosphoribosyltransferase-like PRPP-binding protein